MGMEIYSNCVIDFEFTFIRVLYMHVKIDFIYP